MQGVQPVVDERSSTIIAEPGQSFVNANVNNFAKNDRLSAPSLNEALNT